MADTYTRDCYYCETETDCIQDWEWHMACSECEHSKPLSFEDFMCEYEDDIDYHWYRLVYWNSDRDELLKNDKDFIQECKNTIYWDYLEKFINNR